MAARTFSPPLEEGKERKRRVSDRTGGVIVTALFPASLERGLQALARKRGITFSELLRQIVTSNQQLMREIEDSRPVRKAR